MSSNVFRCCFADVFEEHLSSMRFRSLRMKLSLDLVNITNKSILPGNHSKASKIARQGSSICVYCLLMYIYSIGCPGSSKAAPNPF